MRADTDEIEEHEFLRIELAVAWVQFEIGTSRAIRGEACSTQLEDVTR